MLQHTQSFFISQKNKNDNVMRHDETIVQEKTGFEHFKGWSCTVNMRTAIHSLRLTQLTRRLVGLCILIVILLVLNFPVKASEQGLSCLINIDGVTYETDPCNVNLEDDNVIRFGHLSLEEGQGYRVYLIKREDGRYDGYWNEDFHDKYSDTPLGVLRRENRSGSDCFINNRTLLCRNIPFDTPIYDVEFQSLEEGGNVVLAYLNGIRYRITHLNWDALQPYSIGPSADLDGDGHLEFLIRVSNGGNCCPADISILSYRGNKFFTFLDESPISGGWGGVEIVTQAGSPIIRIQDVPTGIGNLSVQRRERDYALVDGRPELIAERTEVGFVSQVAGLNLKEVQSSEGQQKDLVFDIDQDGQQDVLSCGYWERWGVLNCTGTISGSSTEVDIQCGRVSITNTVFGPQKSHKLLCDGEVVEY